MKKTIALRLLVLFLFATTVLACGSEEPAQDEISTDQQVEDLPADQSMKDAESEPESQVQLGDEYRSAEGGYAFQVVPGYALEEAFGLVSLDAPDADPDVGPSMILIGGINEETRTNEQLLDNFLSGLEEGVEVSNQREVIVDGIPGIMVDVEASIDGNESLGRVVMVAVTPYQMFSVIAAAPPERMSGEFEDIFNAVLASVTFFDPETEAMLDEEPVPSDEPVAMEEPLEKNIIRQWASSATASSEYSAPEYSALQATGAPDTPDCGDQGTAWSSVDGDTIEWLQVAYSTPVIPTEVHIYESHTPTQVSLVEILDLEGNYHQVYEAVPEMMIDCPWVLSVEIEDANYLAAAVKITIDQSVITLPWDQIDAVELVGYVQDDDDTAVATAEPTQLADKPQPTKASQPPSTTTVDATDISSWGWTSYDSGDGLADDKTLSIAVAEDGTVWAGNFNFGVSRIKDGVITNYGEEDGLGYHDTNAVAVEQDGSVWAGTTVGLGYFDGSTWTNYTRADGLIYETVKSLLIAPDGSLWVGTSSGVSHYDGDSWMNYTKDDGLVGNSINDMAVDKEGNLWFATLDGVSYFDGQNWISYTEEDGLAYDITTAIAVAPDGSVWVATSSKGVSRFDGQNWSTYQQSDDYDLSYVKAIEVSQDGALWFTTEGDGIYRYDGENWLNIRKSDGLPGDYVDAMAVAPDGSLWFGFRREGVARFGP